MRKFLNVIKFLNKLINVFLLTCSIRSVYAKFSSFISEGEVVQIIHEIIIAGAASPVMKML